MRFTLLLVFACAVFAQPEIQTWNGGRGVYFNSPAGRVALNPLLLWASIQPSKNIWPGTRRRRSEVRLDESAPALLIQSLTPSLEVQGFTRSANFELVRMNGNSTRLRRKNVFSSDLMSNRLFEDRDLLAVLITPVAPYNFTVRPAAPLAAGEYLLCGQLLTDGWMRVCYPFEVASPGR